MESKGTKDFEDRLKAILSEDLPKGRDIVDQGLALADEIEPGRTLFMERMGVDSESAYKAQCIGRGSIMSHAHIGMSTWGGTAEALQTLYKAGKERGFSVDRFGLCLERRMSLPQELWRDVPAETGPMLESDSDWEVIGRCVPIQPHMGDFMIGFPAATRNTIKALKAGVTTIGNLSQFFSHEAPGWSDHVKTTVETVRAISILGGLRHRGMMLHSYLEDGFGALFLDCATMAGWAYLERYIVEDLLGAKLSHCIGGLTSDPVKRAGWVFALNDIHDGNCLGSMFYGDTISFTKDFAANRAAVCEYLLWDILAQLKCPTGHAVHPLPETEGIRVPSAQEIVESQAMGKRIESSARRLIEHVDFTACRNFADSMTSAGKKVCHNALDGLKQAGVNIKDPVHLLYALKKLGPARFETMFGAGTPDESFPRGQKPVAIT